MVWRKKFNIDNKNDDDLRPGQRLVVYYSLKDGRFDEEPLTNHLSSWLWNITPDEFEEIMNWSPRNDTN